MIKLGSNAYFGEVLLRQSATEEIKKAKLAKNIWIDNTQVVKSSTADNMNNYLYTEQGKPTYTTYGGGGAIWFGSALDIAYMKSGIGCRSISGTCQGINTNYDTNTSATYCFVVNMTGQVSCNIIVTKRSYGFYQTEGRLYIRAGENSGEWFNGFSSSMSFSIKYNGSAYVATCAGKSVTSEECREQVSRLELAGSNKTVSGAYAGLVGLKGEVTTGMARY